MINLLELGTTKRSKRKTTYLGKLNGIGPRRYLEQTEWFVSPLNFYNTTMLSEIRITASHWTTKTDENYLSKVSLTACSLAPMYLLNNSGPCRKYQSVCLMVCLHWQTPRQRPIKIGLYRIMWRCSYWSDTQTDANFYWVPSLVIGICIGLGLGVRQCEWTISYQYYNFEGKCYLRRFTMIIKNTLCASTLILMKLRLHSLATTPARSVFPVPGAPYKSSPDLSLSAHWANNSGYYKIQQMHTCLSFKIMWQFNQKHMFCT